MILRLDKLVSNVEQNGCVSWPFRKRSQNVIRCSYYAKSMLWYIENMLKENSCCGKYRVAPEYRRWISACRSLSLNHISGEICSRDMIMISIPGCNYFLVCSSFEIRVLIVINELKKVFLFENSII